MFEMVKKPFGENMFTKGGLEYFKIDLFLHKYYSKQTVLIVHNCF